MVLIEIMWFQFLEKMNSEGEMLVSPFQRRIEKTIDDLYPFFQQVNDEKSAKYIISIRSVFFVL